MTTSPEGEGGTKLSIISWSMARAMAPSLWAAVLLYSTRSLEEEEWRMDNQSGLWEFGLHIFQSIHKFLSPPVAWVTGPATDPSFHGNFILIYYTLLYQKRRLLSLLRCCNLLRLERGIRKNAAFEQEKQKSVLTHSGRMEESTRL